MAEEIHPELDEKLGELAADAGMPKGTVISQIERSYGIELAEVSDEDAEKFVTAFNDGDPDRVAEVLRDNGVDEDDVERFLEFVEEEEGNDEREATDTGAERKGNGHDPDTEVSQTSTTDSGGSSDYVTKEELDAQLDTVADRVASQVTSKLQSAGSSQPAQGQQAQQNPQNQTQAALAQALAQKFLNDGGSSQAAALGEKFQSKAMESAMQRMFAPDPFDIMRQKWAMQQAEQFMEDDELKEMFGANSMFNTPSDDDDEEPEDGKSGLFKF